MRVVRDALRGRHCVDCKFFHNPMGNPLGHCTRNPPIPLIAGMQPDPEELKKAQAKQQMQARLVDPTKPAAPIQVRMVPVLFAFIPSVGDEDGCWDHEKADGEIVVAPDIDPPRPM